MNLSKSSVSQMVCFLSSLHHKDNHLVGTSSSKKSRGTHPAGCSTAPNVTSALASHHRAICENEFQSNGGGRHGAGSERRKLAFCTQLQGAANDARRAKSLGGNVLQLRFRHHFAIEPTRRVGHKAQVTSCTSVQGRKQRGNSTTVKTAQEDSGTTCLKKTPSPL